MKKKIKYGIIIIIIVWGIIIPIGKRIHENSHVKFADETMGEVISRYVRGGNIAPEDVTYKDLKSITRLDIGFSVYYETITDIKYCTGVKKIIINLSARKNEPSWYVNEGKVDREPTKEEMEKLQEELGEILPKLPNLKVLYLSNKGGSIWTSVEFLKNCDQIEEISIYGSSATDYSALKTCTSAKKISLGGSQISKAEDIIGLSNLEYIGIDDTPLAENEEEVKKLQEAYPDALIDVLVESKDR